MNRTYKTLTGIIAAYSLITASCQKTIEPEPKVIQKWVEVDGNENTAERDLCIKIDGKYTFPDLRLILSQEGDLLYRKNKGNGCPQNLLYNNNYQSLLWLEISKDVRNRIIEEIEIGVR